VTEADPVDPRSRGTYRPWLPSLNPRNFLRSFTMSDQVVGVVAPYPTSTISTGTWCSRSPRRIHDRG
jgi:hypothetical protein